MRGGISTACCCCLLLVKAAEDILVREFRRTCTDMVGGVVTVQQALQRIRMRGGEAGVECSGTWRDGW